MARCDRHRNGGRQMARGIVGRHIYKEGKWQGGRQGQCGGARGKGLAPHTLPLFSRVQGI